ncbi:MAG: Ig-like domain-containing protein, partial [Oscillospiraceae bacterium]
TWDETVTVGGADIYWYDDGGGTQVPSALRMQYLDANGAWQDVNITTPFESSIAKNKYNRIEFDRVTTTRLRLYVTVRSGAAGNGIYRFKVYSSVDVASLNEVFLATKPGVMPTLPSNVTAVTSDGALISVPVTWEP